MTMRTCEHCHGPGPSLWSDRRQMYLCVKCHENPYDEFFNRKYLDRVVEKEEIVEFESNEEVEWEDKQAALLKEGWVLGVKDAIREVERRSQLFRNMGPNARPAPGVIKVLDEVVLLLKAMEQRGSYSSQSQLMSPELSADLKKIKEQVGRWPDRCQEKDEAGAQCLLMEGHPDIHRFRDDTAAVWSEGEEK